MKLIFRSNYLETAKHGQIPNYSTWKDGCILKLHSRNQQNTTIVSDSQERQKIALKIILLKCAMVMDTVFPYI